jgi:glycosyltransferase involved in cell wall biosynthesis
MMIRNGVDGSKIKVVFNGVDPQVWGEPVKSTMREEFKIGEDEFVMFCGSRFAYDKGHEFLIQAMADLKNMTDKKFRLVLANDGPFLEQRKQQVKDLGLEHEVIFIGFRKDMKNLIGGSDLYINSSQHEALSFAIIEVLAAGLPVVATDMGGNGDIINDETKCGMLINYNDSTGLAETVKKIIENPELLSELKRNALKAVRERFNLDNMVAQAYNLYIKAVQK